MSDDKQYRLCKYCACFEPSPRPLASYKLNEDVGECRKNEPNDSGWPRVHENDWCGQWVGQPRTA